MLELSFLNPHNPNVISVHSRVRSMPRLPRSAVPGPDRLVRVLALCQVLFVRRSFRGQLARPTADCRDDQGPVPLASRSTRAGARVFSPGSGSWDIASSGQADHAARERPAPAQRRAGHRLGSASVSLSRATGPSVLPARIPRGVSDEPQRRRWDQSSSRPSDAQGRRRRRRGSNRRRRAK